MSLVSEQAAFLVHVRNLLQKAGELGFLVTGGELFRTAEQQALHIKNGRSKTMNSQHMKRLAIDLNFFIEQTGGSLKLVYDVDTLRPVGDYWESLDPANRWGGNWNSFKDTPHFERREGLHDRSQPNKTPSIGRSGGQKLIGAAVGARCPNNRDDVETVQRLLNLCVDSNLPGLEYPLSTDGLFGPKTLAAINAYQRDKVGMTAPDGVISIGGPTIKALFELVPDDINPLMLSLIYLRAADQDVEEFAPIIHQTASKYSINTFLRKAHFLAQIGHESGELRFRQEIADGTAYENRMDLGNSEPGDGPKFKGRGLIQLTGRANYRAYGRAIGKEEELMSNPQAVAENPELCVDVAGWYWDKRGLNERADSDDLEAVTRKINGGLNGLADRRRILERSKTLVGV